MEEPQGGDIQAQIQQGVQAFMESQDPAIAVEVVKLLASQMGMAPEVQPFEEAAPAPAKGAEQGVPLFKKGGSIAPKKNYKYKRAY